jgi:hypothetical protein
LHFGQLGQPGRRHGRAGPAVVRHDERGQVAQVAFAGRARVMLRAGRIEVAAGRAGRNLLPILLVGAAGAHLVHVEAVRARRQACQARREHEAGRRFRDRHVADHLAGAVGVHEGHRGLQLLGGVRAGGCRERACECDEGFASHTVSFQGLQVWNVSPG